MRDIMTASKVSVFEVILVRIQSECGKIRTRITPNTDTFYAVYDGSFWYFSQHFQIVKNNWSKFANDIKA